MKKSYECEVATHIGPESCGAARKGGVIEALTGERAGRVFSRVRTFLRDADAVRRSGRPNPAHGYRQDAPSALERVRQAAKKDKQLRFTLHHIWKRCGWLTS